MVRSSVYSFDLGSGSKKDTTRTEKDGKYTHHSETSPNANGRTTINSGEEKAAIEHEGNVNDFNTIDDSGTPTSNSSISDDKTNTDKEEPKMVGVTEVVSFINIVFQTSVNYYLLRVRP